MLKIPDCRKTADDLLEKIMLTYRFREPTKPNGEKPPLLLLLHGIGADENDLFGLAPYLDERFFIASARAPFTLPWGGFAWFELGINGTEISVNIKQAEQSRRLILEAVDEMIAAHDLGAVYLGGFSQGAFMSLSAALGVPEKFAGVVAMSGRAMEEMLPPEDSLENLRDFPILVTHGIFDPVLPVENGRATKEILSRLPVKLEYKEYEMGHEISRESLTDMANWLRVELDG